MPTREVMQDLRQMMSDAHEVRSRELAELKASVHTQIMGLDRARKEMTAQLRSDLAETKRNEDMAASHLMSELHQMSANRKATVNAQLRQFDREMQEVATIRAGGQAAWRGAVLPKKAKKG